MTDAERSLLRALAQGMLVMLKEHEYHTTAGQLKLRLEAFEEEIEDEMRRALQGALTYE